ncbi:unnamed protein product [Musa hybrid cultivar]
MMAPASRLLHLTSSPFIRSCKFGARSISPSLLLPSPYYHRRFPFSLPLAQPPSLRSHATCSAAAIAADGPVASVDEPPASSHPWPEWDRFLDKLRGKGYFVVPTSTIPAGSVEGDGASVSSEHDDASVEVNRVKNACLKFSRERFDIFSSLPREDIQAVVEYGCPNVFRKAVNSAKRLRAYLQLDEGDVCGACNLRGACDKAYIIPKEDEGPRTVDIMRILLSYAVNLKQLSGGANSAVKEQVQKSARNLLSELIKLSDTIIDPTVPGPVMKSPSPKEPSQKVRSGKDSRASNVEMKRGDWLCPNCNFLNFARNLRCLECKEDGPKKVHLGSAEMKVGDWTCPECEFMNFARNRECFRCRGARPKRELNPGEWECPLCYYLNFRRNRVCKKCNGDRPVDEGNQLEDHSWRSPKDSKKNNPIKFEDDDGEVVDHDDGTLPYREKINF